MKSKKIVFSAPFQVELWTEEVDSENIPPDSIAIKTDYTLISPGTDMSCLAGKEFWFELPNTPGYSAVGEILGTGENITDFQKGNKVFFYGSNRQYQLVPDSELIMKVPAGDNEKFVPFIRLATIAMTAIRVAPVELGDTVVITGLGPVGNFAAQLSKLAGAKVIGIDPSASRRKLALNCGADFVLDPVTCDLKEEITKLTDGRGADIAIEASGMTQVIESTLPLLKTMGQLILLGTPRAPYMTDATAMYRQTHDGACITVKGASEWRYPVKHEQFVKHSMERNSRIVMELLDSGKLNAAPLLTHLLPPEQAAAAYEGVRNDRESYFGVIFDWTK